MTFRPGQSGNPGGRPRVAGEIRDLARQHTATALATLAEIAERGENESARVAAASALLDRGWGKPGVPLLADESPRIISFTISNPRLPNLAAPRLAAPDDA